jgi:hypothetical protein
MIARAGKPLVYFLCGNCIDRGEPLSKRMHRPVTVCAAPPVIIHPLPAKTTPLPPVRIILHRLSFYPLDTKIPEIWDEARRVPRMAHPFATMDWRHAMKKDIKFLIARNRMLYGRKEADWDTEDYARFVNQYLRDRGYDNVDLSYVDDYPEGNADEQAALREEIESAYRSNRRSNNPTDRYAR